MSVCSTIIWFPSFGLDAITETMWRCSRCLQGLVIRRDRAGHRARGKFGAGHKTHQRTEAPGCRGAEEVQAGNRGLETGVQLRIAIHLANRGKQFPAEKR